VEGRARAFHPAAARHAVAVQGPGVCAAILGARANPNPVATATPPSATSTSHVNGRPVSHSAHVQGDAHQCIRSD
jgi:hypothetical protein